MLEADPRAKKEEWRRDLKQIKALGFNAVRCWIDWASGEPAPGQYRLDTLDVLLSLAEEEGLRVVVQVYMDSAPEWVGRQYPDSLFVSSSGQAIRPESSPGYCLDHPGVRRADLAFYETVARRARASSAFLGFDLWSEPHVINWAEATYYFGQVYLAAPYITNDVYLKYAIASSSYGDELVKADDPCQAEELYAQSLLAWENPDLEPTATQAHDLCEEANAPPPATPTVAGTPSETPPEAPTDTPTP